ncbi:hypothetical protein RXV95_00360 [Novosphingobium sp. ZN18A2]|uniref:DUF3617 domain-containing protein n=1 Tax=Novosphingobium sp. ZN18A2 TaxID=3079861 RepID=UPI0030D589A4
MTPLRRLALAAALPALAGAAIAVGVAVPSGEARPQQPTLQMLDQLQPGLWELRDRTEKTSRKICIASGRALIQIRHPGEACKRLVVEDSAQVVTVQYTCPGSGYGRTSVRMESPTLAQLDTQGIAQGRPFDFSAEVRRVGPCNG